jgi:hypothetical protein
MHMNCSTTTYNLPPITLLLLFPILSACSLNPVSILETASGSVATIQERADALTAPVIERVEELDRRIDAVQKGVEKVREGADLLRQGVGNRAGETIYDLQNEE